MMEDIAVLTGGKAILKDLGVDIKNITLDDLGTAKKVIVDKDSTTLIEGAGTSETIHCRMPASRSFFVARKASLRMCAITLDKRPS